MNEGLKAWAIFMTDYNISSLVPGTNMMINRVDMGPLWAYN